jgi:hypothetical protein
VLLTLKKSSAQYVIVGGLCLVVLAVLLYWLQPDIIFYFTAGWAVIISILLWVGNRQLTVRLDTILPWSRYGNWRFFAQLFLGLSYLLILINVIYYGIKIFLTDDPPTLEQLIVMNVWGSAIFIPLFSLYFSLHFLRHWRESELAVEKIQRERMRSQLDSLKNHLDPHFLFNNLNILSALIDKDQTASKVFIEKFAEVYRALLNTKSEDLIPLQDELSFIESYVYLIRVRFENLIIFESELHDTVSRMLPPLTLQMLVENAIKHNVISESKPLKINLSEKDRYLVIRNTVYAKPGRERAVGGTGLENIRMRYSHFTDLPVVIEQTDQFFEVQIPLLAIERL